MDKHSLLLTALALAIACRCGTTLASEADDHHVGPGIHEVADPELADMRGRYVVGDNTVLWFGVEMISTWQTNNGQTLRGTLTLSMDFSKNANQPQVTFVPTVTITTIGSAAPTSTASNVSRSVQSGGLANVGGLVQSVQIAGDHNAAGNVTSLSIQNNSGARASNTLSLAPSNSAGATSSSTIAVTGPMVNVSGSTTNLSPSNPSSSNVSNTNTVATTTTGTSIADGRAASAGNASVSSTYSNDSAQVNLSVADQGSVSQWVSQGSLGQTIALTADSQIVTNQMIVSMVTQSVNATTSQLAHNLAQSLNLSHSNR
ncbi:hypothetical protein [Dyella acidisoli]|uniref:Uncharacterized protein n=1 Tax=Dyella acidisoli TaxID=1867834 RepID=A0ABQ5XJ94_9GAMM|nr:hypothetical protein [Dyella acidisoli]GLQ91750.1 hypothetical protein GCM10007901_07000 [Dyella acidisoli]